MPLCVDQACPEVLLPSDIVDDVLSHLLCKASQANLCPASFTTLCAGKAGLLGTNEGLWGLPAGVDFRDSQSGGHWARATAEDLGKVSPRTDCTSHSRKQEVCWLHLIWQAPFLKHDFCSQCS